MINNIKLRSLTLILLFLSCTASAMEEHLEEDKEELGPWGPESDFYWDLDLQKTRNFDNWGYLGLLHAQDNIFKNIMVKVLTCFKNLNRQDIVNILMVAVRFRNKFYPVLDYENLFKELTLDLQEAHVYDYNLHEAYLRYLSSYYQKKPQSICEVKDSFQNYPIMRYESIDEVSSQDILWQAMNIINRSQI